MGILNVTPDSFSDGGRFDSLDAALRRVEEMVDQGVDIVDVGGESTRPQSAQVSEVEEIGRVVPVIEAIATRFDVPISIDTYKSGVAESAVRTHLPDLVYGRLVRTDADMSRTGRCTWRSEWS